jgi:hypothetical protein
MLVRIILLRRIGRETGSSLRAPSTTFAQAVSGGVRGDGATTWRTVEPALGYHPPPWRPPVRRRPARARPGTAAFHRRCSAWRRRATGCRRYRCVRGRRWRRRSRAYRLRCGRWASSATSSGAWSPAVSALSMARADTPSTSVATLASLMFAVSRTFCFRRRRRLSERLRSMVMSALPPRGPSCSLHPIYLQATGRRRPRETIPGAADGAEAHGSAPLRCVREDGRRAGSCATLACSRGSRSRRSRSFPRAWSHRAGPRSSRGRGP